MGANQSVRNTELHPSKLQRLIREPLLHFLLLGALLFALYGYVHGGQEEAPGENQVLVPAGKIEHLTALFTRTWQRPPTRSELEGLVDDYVREEVAYREGVLMGLDRNDTIIRRRIRQKLDFVAQDFAERLNPTDEQLADFIREHQSDYQVAPRVTFQQIFFDPAKHPDDLEDMVSDLAVNLQEDSSIDPREQGDRTLLEFHYSHVSPREVASLFGEDFATAILELEPGSWHAPVRSAFGIHAVRVDRLEAGRLQSLDEARAAVTRDWTQTRTRELVEQFYQGLLDRYDVSIDWPAFESDKP